MRVYIITLIGLVMVASCQVSYQYQARQDVLCPINMGLTLNDTAPKRDPLAFTPVDISSYTHVASITQNDFVGIQRLVTLYFVATDDTDQSWYVYLSIDGEQLDIQGGTLAANDYRAGRILFNSSGDLRVTEPDRFRSPQLIFDDDQYEYQFIITIDPTTTVLGSEYAATISVPGCQLD